MSVMRPRGASSGFVRRTRASGRDLDFPSGYPGGERLHRGFLRLGLSLCFTSVFRKTAAELVQPPLIPWVQGRSQGRHVRAFLWSAQVLTWLRLPAPFPSALAARGVASRQDRGAEGGAAACWPSQRDRRCRLLPAGPRVKLAAGVRSGRRRGQRSGAEMRHVGALLRFSVVRFLELRSQILVGCKTCFLKHFGSGTFTFIYV